MILYFIFISFFSFSFFIHQTHTRHQKHTRYQKHTRHQRHTSKTKYKKSYETPLILITRNQQAQFTNQEQEVSYDRLCEVKEGYIYQMLSMPYLQQQDYVLEIRPVFAVVNKQSISLFENQNVNALVKSEQIHQTVNCQPYKFTNINCFQCGYDIVAPYFGAQNELVNLCSKSPKSALEWMTAIQEYPHCEVRQQNQY